MKKTSISATTLEKIILITLLLITGLVICCFYFVQIGLIDYARNNTNISNTTTNNTKTTEQDTLQKDILNQKIPADKAIALVIPRQNFKDNIKQDLNKYASDTGVTITNYETTQPPTIVSNVPLINGVQSDYVKITLQNPVTFINLLKFIKAIESNIPKMNITGITINHTADSSTLITVEPITIEVYTR